jgi:hypothetical protein
MALATHLSPEEVMANLSQTLMADLQLSLLAMANVTDQLMAADLSLSLSMMAELRMSLDLMASLREDLLAGLNCSMAGHPLAPRQGEDDGGRQEQV